MTGIFINYQRDEFMMTESEFLISRALAVFNTQYKRDIKVQDCDIISIKPDPQSARGYEITTPRGSEFFRIRYYFKWDTVDKGMPARLEVTMPYKDGELGDEVYVIHSLMDVYWEAEGGYKFDDIGPNLELPGLIISEFGVPIVTESGLFWIQEKYIR